MTQMAGEVGIQRETQRPDVTSGRVTGKGERRWVSSVLVALLCLAGFGLYVSTLGRHSFWFDEGLTALRARESFGRLLYVLGHEDIHPPLYFALLHFCRMLVGESEFAIRFVSVASGVLLIPLTYATAREVYAVDDRKSSLGRVAGVIAAALVCTSQFLSYYAQEARPYALVILLGLSATYVLLRAVRSEKWWLWGAYSVLVAASLYTQYLVGFAFAAHAVFVLMTERRQI